jgi:hypothetical protein
MIETGVTMKTKIGQGVNFGVAPAHGLLAALGLALAAVPVASTVAHAQSASVPGETTEARVRRLEAEVRALQRKVFPDGAGRTFGPEITATAPAATPPPPAVGATPLTDVLSRLDAVEAQLRQVTAATEENQNHLSKLDSRVSALETAAAPPPHRPPHRPIRLLLRPPRPRRVRPVARPPRPLRPSPSLRRRPRRPPSPVALRRLRRSRSRPPATRRPMNTSMASASMTPSSIPRRRRS